VRKPLPKRKTKPYHHGDLREEVLRLALASLETSPADALTLRGLARRAGVSSMALYRHFADRDALLVALAAAGFDDLGKRMNAVDRVNDPRAALVALGTAYVQFAVERPGLFRLMYGGKPPNIRTMPGEAPHPAYAALSRRIAELANKVGERDTAFLASWSLVHGLATLFVTERIREPIADPVAVAEQVCRFFVGAFRVPKSTSPAPSSKSR
jgi:AcrR family transcriptional regulator